MVHRLPSKYFVDRIGVQPEHKITPAESRRRRPPIFEDMALFLLTTGKRNDWNLYLPYGDQDTESPAARLRNTKRYCGRYPFSEVYDRCSNDSLYARILAISRSVN